MPLGGDGNYSLPPGTYGVPNTPIESNRYNLFLDDLVAVLNTPRPISKGGTGATSAAGALVNLGAMPSVPGMMVPYGGLTAPSGWLLCYGQAVSRTTYSTLFAAIGTQFGDGNGSTTFNLPDLRGRVVAGQDDMGGTSANRLTAAGFGASGDDLGAAGGSETHELTVAQLAEHDHGGETDSGGIHSHTNTYNRKIEGTGAAEVEFAEHRLVGRPNQDNEQFTLATANSVAHTHDIAAQGDGDPHPNVQPTLIANYIIKT